MTYVLWVVASLLLLDGAHGACANATSHSVSVDHLDDLLFGGESSPAQIVIASVLVFLITSVAVAAGIGGGGLLVPLYFIALDIEQTRAVSLSKGTIFGVAVGNVFFLSSQRHPKVDRPLIDYSTAVFMQGGELMGVVLGVLLNLLLPEIVTILLSAVVLGFNAYKTLHKAVARYKDESKKMLAKSTSHTSPPTTSPTMLFATAPDSKGTAGTVVPVPQQELAPGQVGQVLVAVEPAGGAAARASKLLAADAKSFQLWAWCLLCPMVIFFVLYSLLLGKVFDPNFTNCVPGYWPAYAAPFVFYGCITAWVARRNMRLELKRREAGIARVDGDIVWTPKAAGMLVPAAIGAGVAAGLLGIGGGMILGPIFVALDFQPQVGTATTGFMILFTAFGGSVKYLTIGKLPWRHFLWFASVGALGGQTGQRVVRRVILKTGRPSLVVFILGGIIALAVIVMTTFGVKKFFEELACGVDVWSPSTEQFVCSE